MLYLKASIVVLAVLCVNCEVHSALTMVHKQYDFRTNHLLIGKHHVDKERIVYALCTRESRKLSTFCKVTLDKNAFDSSVRNRTCELKISTQYASGRIELLGVDLFGEDKVFFRWQDVNLDQNEQAEILSQLIDMQSCDLIFRKLIVDYHSGANQTFFVPLPHRFVVVYKNKFQCDEYFCKITVYPDGAASFHSRWFRTTELVNTIDAFEDNSNMYFCSAQENGRIGYFFMDEAGPREVTSLKPNEPFGWSTTNGIYSICKKYFCTIYNHEGKKIKDSRLSFGVRKYAALYNLPQGRYWAVVCGDNPDSSYRLIRISKRGTVEFSVDLDGLQCSENYEYMTAKIYQERYPIYCLSLFHSKYGFEGYFLFKKYCVSIYNK